METQPKRSLNFTKDEEYLLISLVAKYKNVIESKATNAVTWKEKNEKWIQVEREFNANGALNGRRSVKMLKEKYINLKKKTKKKISQNKLNVNLTGGGPSTQEVLSEVDAAISDLLGERITGLPSIFDSDKDLPQSQDDVFSNSEPGCSGITKTNKEIIQPKENNQKVADVEGTPTINGGNWEKYCPKDLQQPINSKLAVTNRKAVLKRSNLVTKEYNSVNRELIEKKLEFVIHQKKKFDEENTLKMQCLEKDIIIKNKTIEKINLEMELLKKELYLKEKQIAMFDQE